MTFIGYTTNLGINKYLASLKYTEAGLRKFLFKSNKLKEPIAITNPITSGDEYYLGNGLWESNSGSPSRNMIHDLEIHSFPVSFASTKLYDSYEQELSYTQVTAYADTWTPQNPSSRYSVSRTLVSFTNGTLTTYDRNPPGMLLFINDNSTLISQEITETTITLIVQYVSQVFTVEILAEIIATKDGGLIVKEDYGDGNGFVDNQTVERGVFQGFNEYVIIRNSFWLANGATRQYSFRDWLIQRQSPADSERFSTFVAYTEVPSSYRPPIIKEEYIENYSGIFLAQKTANAYIYQNWSATRTIKIDIEDASKNENKLTEITNTLTLKINPEKAIILNNSDFLVASSLISQSPITADSTSIILTTSQSYSKDFNVNSAVGQPILFGKTIDSFPALIRGVITSANYSLSGVLTLNITISKILLKTYTSFLDRLITDNGSYYSYHFRKKIPATFAAFVNKSLLKVIPLNPIISTFLSDNYVVEINEITGINLQTDNIVNQKIYSVVNISGNNASVEKWNIQADGKIKYNGVLRTPYYKIPKDSVIFGNSFYP